VGWEIAWEHFLGEKVVWEHFLGEKVVRERFLAYGGPAEEKKAVLA
jgi:hypothetical protein